MTHDSIGLGEDGPTHQPVEHLAALRAMPQLNVFRPADAVETAECWEFALENRHAPSILALTRQPLPLLRTEPHRENRSAKGAYVLAEADGARQVTLLATGSEVAIAMEAREALAKDGIRAAVVSMPCWELFESQAQEYRDVVLGTAPRVGVEAAVQFGWDRWLGRALGLCRDAQLWRLSADRRALPAFRHYRREGCRGRPLASIDRRKPSEERTMTIRVAINGFGRIGRLVMRAAWSIRRSELEIVGINDLGPVATNAHLLNYDSVHGRFAGEVTTGDNWMDAGQGKVRVTAERDPAKLPWKELGVDVALECTGIFTKREAAAKHLEAGAKKVIVSAPADGVDLTVVMGVNHEELKPEHQVISNGVVHDQLPGAGRLCAASGHRHRARLHDDDPCLYRRPEPAGHAAQRSAPGARRGACR